MVSKLDYFQAAVNIAQKQSIDLSKIDPSLENSIWIDDFKIYALRGKNKNGTIKTILRIRVEDLSIELHKGDSEFIKVEEDPKLYLKKRLKDKGWGYAISSTLIPFVLIYYSFSRKTITPLLFTLLALLICLLKNLIISAFYINIFGETEGLRFFEIITNIPIFIFFIKNGINQSREYAIYKLNMISKNNSSKENFNEEYQDWFNDSEQEQFNYSNDNLFIPFWKRNIKILKEKFKSNSIDDLEKRLLKLKNMLDKGVITKSEYKKLKNKYLDL